MMKRLLQLFCTLLCFHQASQADVVWDVPEGVPTTAMPSEIVDTSRPPQIGVDSMGNARAVWTYTNGNGDDAIRLTEFDFNTNTWSPFTNHSPQSPGQNFTDPVIAVNASGQAVAAWVQPGSTISILESYFDGASWSVPTELDGSIFGEQVAVAIDLNGNAYAIWINTNDFPNRLVAKRRPIATKMWDPTNTGSLITTNANQPTIGVDANGKAIAAWVDLDASGYGNDLIEAGSIGLTDLDWAPVSFDEDPPVSRIFQNPKIVVNGSGDAALAWEIPGSFITPGILVAYYLDSAGGGFDNKEEFTPYELPGDVTGGFDIAIDPTGQAVLVYSVPGGLISIGDVNFSIFSGGSWSASSPLASDFTAPKIGLDSEGNGIALMKAQVGMFPGPVSLIVSASSFTKIGSSWSIPEQVSSNAERPTFGEFLGISHSLAVAECGEAVGIWGGQFAPNEFTVEKNYAYSVSASESTVVADPTIVLADGVASSTITVTVKDMCGNPIGGVDVTLAKDSLTAMIPTPQPQVTNASGEAFFTTTDDVEEVVTYTATAGGVVIIPTAKVTFTNTPPPPSGGGSFNLGSVVIFVRSLLMPGYIPMTL